MDSSFDAPCYRVTKMFCSLVGLWPYQPQYKRRILQSFQMFILYFTYIPPQINRLYQVWGKDIDAMCVCLSPLLNITLYIVNTATIVGFEPEIRILMHQIEAEWEIGPGIKEGRILANYMSKSRKLSIMCSIVMCNGLLCFIIVPTLSPMLDIAFPLNETRPRFIPFDLDYGVDQEDYWFWIWLHYSTSGTIVIFNALATQLLYIMFTVHSSCLFAITRHKLEHIADPIAEDVLFNDNDYDAEWKAHCHDEPLKSEKRLAILRECILNHKKALEYAQLLRRIYTWNLLAVISINLMTISIAAVQLVSKLSRWSEIILSFLYLTAAQIYLFFLALMAQNILDESAGVHESAYSSSWYNIPSKHWRDLALILMRSDKPCKLTAGKLVVMSLESFCTILRTSMSYFMLLASFR